MQTPLAKQEAGTGHAAAWAVDSHGAPAAAKRLDRFAMRLDHRLRDPAAARLGALSLAEEKKGCHPNDLKSLMRQPLVCEVLRWHG